MDKQIMIYILSNKMIDTLITWMNLKCTIMLKKKPDSKDYIIPFTRHSGKGKTIGKKNRSTDVRG